MQITDITFSVNRYDCEGFIDQQGVFLHFGDCAVVKVCDSVQKFDKFVERVNAIARDIEMDLNNDGSLK